jgi:hypothetical protein
MKSSFGNLMGVVLAQGQGYKDEMIKSRIQVEA